MLLFFFVSHRGAFGTQSNIYGGGFFCKKSQQLIAVNYFCKRAPPWALGWVLNTVLGSTLKKKKNSHVKDIPHHQKLFVSYFMVLGNAVKKQPSKRYSPCYQKLCVSLFLSCIFYFVGQIRKICNRNKWKTEPLMSTY